MRCRPGRQGAGRGGGAFFININLCAATIKVRRGFRGTCEFQLRGRQNKLGIINHWSHCGVNERTPWNVQRRLLAEAKSAKALPGSLDPCGE